VGGYVLLTRPMVQQMDLIEQTMCGPPMDFAFTMTRSGVLLSTPTQAFERTEGPIKSLFDAVIASGDSTSTPVMQHFNSLEELRSVWYMDPRRYLEDLEKRGLRSGCDDTDFTTAPVFLVNALQRMTRDNALRSCAASRKYCDSVSIARTLCPVTCGCDVPHTGLYFTGALAGCPVTACARTDRWEDAISALTCANEFGTSGAWHRFLDGLAAAGDATTSSHLRDLGCTALAPQGTAAWAHERLCRGDGQSAGLADFCPATCGCDADPAVSVRCPLSCSTTGLNISDNASAS